MRTIYIDDLTNKIVDEKDVPCPHKRVHTEIDPVAQTTKIWFAPVD